MAVHYCTQCGTKLTEVDRFCFKCGTPSTYAPVDVQPEIPEAEPFIPEVIPVEEPVTNQQVKPEVVTFSTFQIDAQPAAPVSKEPKVRPRRKALAVVASVLVCILLAALLLPTALLVTARMALDEDHLLTTLQRIELDSIPAELFVGEDGDGMMLDEWLCREINTQVPDSLRISSQRWEELTPRDLKKLLSETTLLKFAAESIEEIGEELLLGEGSFEIDRDDIEEFLEDNRKFLEKEFDMNLRAGKEDVVARQILLVLGVDEISLPELDDVLLTGLEIGGYAISVLVLAVMGGLITLLIVLLFLINRKYPRYAVRDTGIVFLVCSVILLLVIAAGRGLAYVFAGENGILYLVGVICGGILESGLIFTAGLFGFGVVMLLVNIIWKHIQMKKTP